MMVSKKKRLAMDSSKVLLQKVDGSLKSFRSQPLQKTLTPNTLILGPGNTGLPGSTWLGSPHQSCFCAVTKRVLWTGQGAGGVVHRQSQWMAVQKMIQVTMNKVNDVINPSSVSSHVPRYFSSSICR